MFQYSSKSLFSHWPEGIKLLYLLLVGILAVALRDANSQFALLVVVFIMLAASGYKSYAALALGIFPFLALTDLSFYLFIFNPRLDLAQIILVSNLRIINIFLSIAFFTFTTDIFALLAFLRRLHLPEFIYLPVYIVFRFLPEIEVELQDIMAIQKSRGFTPRKPLEYSKAIFVPLLYVLMERSNQLSIAYFLRKKEGKKI